MGHDLPEEFWERLPRARSGSHVVPVRLQTGGGDYARVGR